MNTELKKLELINWIVQLHDISAIKEILKIKQSKTNAIKKRAFGCGKGTFTFIADDFNDPLNDFTEYTP